MKTVWKILAGTASTLAVYSGIHYAIDLEERKAVFAEARAYADQSGKPLLVVGQPRSPRNPFFNHPCGDMTVDTDPGVLLDCPQGSQIADIRSLPFAAGEFGAVFSSHVLEHLPTVADCEQALLELRRVADEIFIVVPKKTSLVAWLIADHHLWVTPTDGEFIIEQR